MDNKISVVIRTYNEEKHIGEVLESLKNQIYKNYEIVIVDSGSTDGTVKILKEFDTKLVFIEKEEFNYSYASNVGVENSQGNIICFLSGHSVPVHDDYLLNINNIFQDKKIGACYGDVIALSDGSIYEKIYNYLGYLKNRIKGRGNQVRHETAIHPGIFSCSNAAARKNLLVKHPFQVDLGNGGEDVEVAYRIIQDGYVIAKVPRLLVKHSHGQNLLAFMKQLKSWRIMYREVLNFINGD